MAKRKRISSWKQKKNYTILAPESFEFRELGMTMANTPDSLIGRSVDVSVSDLMEIPSKQHLKMVFSIDGVTGDKTHTRFKKFEVNKGYMRSRTRKGASKIDYLGTLKFDQDIKVKVKIMVMPLGRTQTSQKKNLMERVSLILGRYNNTKLDDFSQLALSGRLGTEVYHGLKKICPVRRVEVEKIEVL